MDEVVCGGVLYLNLNWLKLSCISVGGNRETAAGHPPSPRVRDPGCRGGVGGTLDIMVVWRPPCMS